MDGAVCRSCGAGARHADAQRQEPRRRGLRSGQQHGRAP